ncbi:MAG: LysE family translocator [Pseudomonadota bacterium]
MPDLSVLLSFVVAALILLVIPGPGVVYVVARTVSQGRAAGLVSVLGLSAGALVHIVAATVGLSAVLYASASAFAVVKALGAAYLIYLGLRTLLVRDSSPKPELRGTHRTLRRLFVDGMVVSVLNPKLAVFFLAFLPQFVAPNGLPAAMQVFALGLLYIGLGLVTDGAYVLLTSRLSTWLQRPAMSGAAPRYASGAIYIGMGIGTALIDRNPTETLR